MKKPVNKQNDAVFNAQKSVPISTSNTKVTKTNQ